MPTWLTEKETALLKRTVRRSKQDPPFDEVTLLHVNPGYAHIRTPEGREKTVSLKHLAQPGQIAHPQEVLSESTGNPQTNTVYVPPERASLGGQPHPVPSPSDTSLKCSLHMWNPVTGTLLNQSHLWEGMDRAGAISTPKTYYQTAVGLIVTEPGTPLTHLLMGENVVLYC